MFLGCQGQAVVMQLDHCSQQFLTEGCRSPAAGAGNFRNQLSNVQAFQKPRHRIGLSPFAIRVRMGSPQKLSNVGVPEAFEQMIARHHGLKQPHILPSRGIEAFVASSLMHFRFGQFRHLVIRGSGIVHHGQRIEIAFVRGLRVPLILRKRPR